MNNKPAYEMPVTEQIEILLEAAFASPTPNESYQEDENEFKFD
jgi:hypothetical protein